MVKKLSKNQLKNLCILLQNRFLGIEGSELKINNSNQVLYPCYREFSEVPIYSEFYWHAIFKKKKLPE